MQDKSSSSESILGKAMDWVLNNPIAVLVTLLALLAGSLLCPGTVLTASAGRVCAAAVDRLPLRPRAPCSGRSASVPLSTDLGAEAQGVWHQSKVRLALSREERGEGGSL